MKKVIVACGGAVATSTVAANRIKELCTNNGIDLNLVQCRVNEIESHLSGTDLICTTMRVKKTYGAIPVLTVMGFISGINEEKLEEDILGYLK
ncbi:PTS galactitol transporter subunit IIB [Streptococcus cuniculi]|uniref:PTS galactitol transporter subunit IIB n=1 Tax=Streptococcus cuniculi TaxID=1432788 RepID=A0A4Y9J8W4_9STRE|nr:PTS galactitol transporter subunit IIB [Streptococcus cuniculi]MBF0778845.1 PTS galactitol transporter subunit IIB [Streptococcus cuniculi]TFU97227.1 PTS galactitol transporter subunit IIB [Streptococcus cuniculi]